MNSIALGIVLHVLNYSTAVSACAASFMFGCCTRLAAVHAVLCIVDYYAAVTAHAMVHAMLGMLLQFGCCIQDAAATVMEASLKIPEVKSRGLVDLFLLFSFPKGELKRFFVLFGLC